MYKNTCFTNNYLQKAHLNALEMVEKTEFLTVMLR